MIAAITASELALVELVIGILLLLFAAYIATEGGRLAPAAFVAVIGVLFILLAS